MKIIRNIFIIIVTIFYSFVTVSAAQGSPKDSYFSSVDKIYSELYDNQMITESVWNAILNQTHFLIYSSNVNPKSIYISALAFGTDILSSQSSTITSNIKSIKDGYYSLTKEVYYRLYTSKYINNIEYKSQQNQAWDYIYNANSTPQKIYNSALEYEKSIKKNKR